MAGVLVAAARFDVIGASAMARSKPLPDQEYLATCFIYDPDTGDLVWRRRPREHFESLRVFNMWNTSFAGKNAGTTTQCGHRKLFLDNRQVLAHRVIWKLVTGDDPVDEIDHKDVDGTNNRWTNLREATRADNGRNRSSSRTKFDLPRGVHPSGGRFRSRIIVDGVKRELGCFSTPEEAHQAYAEAVLAFHGEFGRVG